MCSYGLAALAVGVVSAVAEGVNTVSQSNDQKNALAEQDRLNDRKQVEVEGEIQSIADQQMSERAAAAQRARASLRVAAGESGVGGAGLSIVENQTQFDNSRDTATIGRNRDRALKQSKLDAEGAKASLQSQMNSLPSAGAVWGQAGLQIAGSYTSVATQQKTGDPSKWK